MDRQDSQHHKASSEAKDAHEEVETVQRAAEAVWSDMLHKVIKRDARSKRFDDIWPQVVESLIIKGFSGVY